MGSDTHDAQSNARPGARFSGFAEEIDPAVRPVHAAGAIAQNGLKYGGAALVIGGALLAVLWPDAPEQMSSLSITREVGGVRASKSFGW